MAGDLALREIEDVLESEGLPGALAHFNRRVLHRFTAVYRVSDGLMRNVAIVDKQREVVPEHLLEVPVAATFCQFVLRDGFFQVHGIRDSRLEGHPSRGIVNSYVGVPLRDGDQVIGTFCQFDFAALPVPQAEFELMQEAAGLLARHVP